jgi:threonine synthase
MNQLICTKCNKQYSLNDKVWRCHCGGVLDIEFETTFPIEKISSRNKTMWRYREAIPIDDDRNIISFKEGFTPLIEIDFNHTLVKIKQDHLFQTGSYKDRGASVLISKIKEMGIDTVFEDSSGNAGCAIAAYCASAGIDCEIFIPKSTTPEKVAQIESYGARLNKIPGSREDTAAAVLKAAEMDGTYYASHSWNPFFFQGTKTFAFELCEQLGWNAPDSVILPVGNGTLLLGVYLGFSELFNLDIIEKIPKMICIQSQSCAPLAQAFKSNHINLPKIEKTETIAEGIAIAEPIRGNQILEAVKQSAGQFIAVADSEIIQALKFVTAQGFYIEPTSAATIAGVFKYIEQEHTDELMVSVFTGHGLKATEKLMKIFKSKDSD